MPTPTTPTTNPNHPRIALLGNPNTGKTTLFNRLTGLRHHTANFPGTTLEARVGPIKLDPKNKHTNADCIDLPGLYALNLDQLEANIARDVLQGKAAPTGDKPAQPDAVCIVVDASNLARNLVLVAQILEKQLPTVIAVNMTDVAQNRGLQLDLAKLANRLQTPVVPINARSGQGLDKLTQTLNTTLNKTTPQQRQLPQPTADEQALAAWAEQVHDHVVTRTNPDKDPDAATNAIDRFLLHPVLGLLVFATVMTALFYAVFSLAAYPMDWIENIFSTLGALVSATIPEGVIHDFLANGVVAGVGATVVFLPQICLLFFLISLLEASGYLARGALIIDRVLRPFGLSGHAFVPFLSSHACAIPGIMATRAINDPKERIAAILTAPFMSCTARIPVYVLLVGILFPQSPAKQTLAFASAYLLGIAAGLLSALIARRTILKGKSRHIALELPTYKRPSLRSALTAAWERGLLFLKKAGTIILAISIILWWLSAYPNAGPSPAGEQLRQQAQQLEENQQHNNIAPNDDGQPDELQNQIEQLLAEAEAADNRHQSRHSFIGRLGATIEPVLAPLGYDRQLAVGVIASFAAREVFVTTMAVQIAGSEETEDEGILTALRTATRDDGTTPIFSTPVCWSLLVYYVLAMQCLPTLVITARESGSTKWAALQLAWMLTLAYTAALLTYQLLA